MGLRPSLVALLSLLACAPAVAPSSAPADSQVGAAAPDAATPAPALAAAPEAEPEATVAAAPERPAVDPGINEPWRSENIKPLVRRLESESREIYVHREQLAQVVAAGPGKVVADIGAGSGFMTLLLADDVGSSGRVYAVDINATMLEQVDARARAAGLRNVETLISPEDRTPLKPGSVDLVFMCDAYHHFAYPRSTMASIHAALRDGGEVVLVDFERIPGKTSPQMMEHVRAGKEVFRQEILDSGFELVTEHEMSELQENYILRFRKK